MLTYGKDSDPKAPELKEKNYEEGKNYVNMCEPVRE